MKIIGFDSETFFSKKLKYSLRNLIAEVYCRSPLFDCYIVSASDGTSDWAGSPKDFNWQVLEGATIVSHNAYWDRSCYAELVRRGIAPQVKFAAWVCSANLTSYLCNRRALAQSVEFLYKVKVSKEARDDSDGKHWPADFSEAEQKRMLDYARGDARWCWRLWNDYSAKWPLSEQRLSNLTIEQGMRGVQIDTALLDQYLIQSHEMKIATEKVLPWLQDDDDEDSWTDFKTTPTSVKCLSEQCRRVGIPCAPVKSHYEDGEERYAEWEETYKKNNPWISALSSWRSINKLYKSFQTVKARLRPDGTIPFGLKYFGAHSGRWSGSDGLNMQNMRKRPILCNELGLLETNESRPGTDWVKYAINFRNLFIPRPGKILIVSDLSQIEPRSLAWLCGNTELLKLVAEGQSIYEAAARASGAFTGDKMDKASVFYAEQKAKLLALGYQAGWERFISMAQDYTGIDITAGDPEWLDDAQTIPGRGQRARQIVADFRAQNPKIVNLWNQLDLAFKRSVGDKLEVVLGSGRRLRYEAIRAERRLKPDKEGKPRLSTVFTCDIGGRRHESYGGKLTENLCQGFARDILAEGMLNVEDGGHRVLWSEHDSIIAECEPGTDPEEIARLMTETPKWCPGLPLAAEAKAVKCYEK